MIQLHHITLYQAPTQQHMYNNILIGITYEV